MASPDRRSRILSHPSSYASGCTGERTGLYPTSPPLSRFRSICDFPRLRLSERALPRRHPQRRRQRARSARRARCDGWRVRAPGRDRGPHAREHRDRAGRHVRLASASRICPCLLRRGATPDGGVLSPRPTSIGHLRIVPAHSSPRSLAHSRLIDATAFGTGLHPTTVMCLEGRREVRSHRPRCSTWEQVRGVLALAALMLGVPRALAIDIDDEALRVAAENARINGMDKRLQLTCGGPDAVTGTWPMVLANVLAAPLIEMAPALVRRVGHPRQLVLSGIPSSVERNVDQAYRRLGINACA